MTYVERDIRGRGECAPAVLRAAIVDRGKRLAADYAPGGIYREPPAGIEDWIIAECRRFPEAETDPDGVTVQMNVETAGFQSKFWVERANPGGIGAVDNNPDLAIDFTEGGTVPFDEAARRGIRAHVAKLRNYRYGEGPWSHEDPRAFAVRQRGWMGTCRTWRDLKGKWATSKTYDTTIEAVWSRMNAIRLELGGSAPPTDRQAMLQRLEAQFPLRYRVSHIPPGNPNRPGGPLVAGGATWITVHETGNERRGANAEMHRQFTHNGGGEGNVSFTYVVDDEEAIELLPRWEKSWQASDGANGIGNSSESIETCVNADGDWTKTRENLARLVCRLIITDEENSPDRIAQHFTWARDGKNCPTRLRANGGREWNALMARVREILTAVGYFGDVEPDRPESDGWFLHLGDGKHATYAYRLGFRGVAEGLARQRYPEDPNSAALALFGPPDEDEWVGVDGCSYQRARKVVFQYIPGNAQPWDVILLDRDAELPERRPA